MQKMKKKRKGFTLTELAIVIAVIAILIAVLVPTFVSLINSANESADEQAVKSMNTALATDEALSGRKTNPSEAMQVLEDYGFNVANYEALDSDNTIYWDSSTNRTLLYSTEKGTVIYPSDAVSLYSTYNLTESIPDYWYTLKNAYVTYKQSDLTTEWQSDPDNSGKTPSLVDLLEYISTKTDSSEATLQLTSDVTVASSYDSTNNGYTTYTDYSSSGSTYASELFSFTGDVSYTIDLNGNTITHTQDITGTVSSTNRLARFVIDNGASLYLKNGTIEDKVESGTYSLFKVNKSSSLTLENVTLTTAGYALFPSGEASQLNVINCNITAGGEGAIATNANTSENYYVQMSIKDSVITADGSGLTNGSDYAVCINVPGTLNISGCTLTGDRQGLIVRAGTAYVSDTTIICTGEYSGGKYYGTASTNDNWGETPELPMGALIIGNQNGTYAGDATMTCYGVTVDYQGDTSKGFDVYMYGGVDCNIVNGERVTNTGVNNKAILNYDSACNLGTITQGEETYTEVNKI